MDGKRFLLDHRYCFLDNTLKAQLDRGLDHIRQKVEGDDGFEFSFLLCYFHLPKQTKEGKKPHMPVHRLGPLPYEKRREEGV